MLNARCKNGISDVYMMMRSENSVPYKVDSVATFVRCVNNSMTQTEKIHGVKCQKLHQHFVLRSTAPEGEKDL